MQNGNFALGGWGARAAAQVRRGGRARRGRATRSRPAGGGGGRVCRGVARGGAAGLGGVAEPRLRARQVGARPGLSGAPSPPGPPPALLGGLGERTRGVGKESTRRGLEGARGSLTTYPGAVGPHVPPKPLGPLLPLVFCRRPEVPLPPPPPELEPEPEPKPEPELEPPPLPPPPLLPPLPRQLQPRAPARARARAPAPAVRVPGAAPPLVHSRSYSRGAY